MSILETSNGSEGVSQVWDEALWFRRMCSWDWNQHQVSQSENLGQLPLTTRNLGLGLVNSDVSALWSIIRDVVKIWSVLKNTHSAWLMPFIKCYENIRLQPVYLKTFVLAVLSQPRSSVSPWRPHRISSNPSLPRSSPKIAERVAQWEEKIKQFRSSCAQVCWDDPVAFMLQHDGYRMPLADLVAPTIGGGNCSGSYGNLVEQFQGTPDGYLHLVECPPGGEAYDVLMVADSSFALVKGHDSGNPTRFIVTELCHPTARVREYHGRLFWGKGLPQIIDGITAGLDEIEDQCRRDGKPIKAGDRNGWMGR